jgi:hypothetical protein
MRGAILEEIRHLTYMYSDPFCSFLELLFEEFDFDGAQVREVA